MSSTLRKNAANIFRPGSRLALISLSLFAFAALQFGCTNGTMGKLTSKTTEGLAASTPGGASSGDGSLLSLTRVIRSSATPDTSFDLVGDGSGSIGQLCVSTTGGAGNTGASTCVCAYDYIRADGSHESFEADTIYRENNLIRCSTASIPAGLGYVKVAVKLVNSGDTSNQITFNFLSGGSVLNLGDASSFSDVKRYQCKDAVYIQNMFTSDSMYDPMQSEDPAISYPLNFYTLNIAKSIVKFAGLDANKPVNGSGWICPTTPNDPSAGMNLNVFSVMPLGGSDYSIYPVAPGGAYDRSGFLLAKKASGVFNVPVNAFIAPNINTTSGGGSEPPLGFGAAPIPVGDGTTERCPDSSVSIPSGYHWVKVWLFRASLEDRKAKKSAAFTSLGPLFCNPGYWPGTVAPATPEYVFKDCHNSATLSATNSLSARVLQNHACVNPSPVGAIGSKSAGTTVAGGTTDCSDPVAGCVQRSGYSQYALGTDIWKYGYTNTQGLAALPDAPGRDRFSDCANSPDPIGLCSSGTTGSNGTSDFSVPKDGNPTLVSIDGGVSRYDYMYVVSPPSINALDFKNATSNSLPYTPLRYHSSKDCQGDPDHPRFAGDCSPSKLIRYGVKFHDIATNGDEAVGTVTSPGNNGRLPVFPVCALQKGTGP
ncbi:MAG: hypothetical protein H7222_04065 [Methylotenera sp.]|nr:hypothetical protein [Oligoflexia bacterium]